MPRGPAGARPLCSTAVVSRSTCLTPSFLALGPTGAHPGVGAGSRERRTGQAEAPSAPAPFSLPLPLLWPAATQGGVARGGLLSQGQSGHPSFTLPGVPMPPTWVTHKCLNSGSQGGPVPCSAYLSHRRRVHPSVCQCSLRATYPLCPEPRRPAAFTAPHLAPPSASALWPLP